MQCKLVPLACATILFAQSSLHAAESITVAPDKASGARQTGEKVDSRVEFEKLLAEDDAAQAQVEQWRQLNRKLAGLAMGQADLDRRVAERLEPIARGYADFIRLHPDHAAARLAYGNLLNLKKDETGAQSQWEKALELDPRNADAYHSLAERYCEIGPAKRAFEYFSKAIEIKPAEASYYHDFADALYVLRRQAATNYGLTEQQVFSRSLLLYSNAVRLDPLNLGFAWDFAQTYYALKPFPSEQALIAWTNSLAGAKSEIDREQVVIHLARVNMLAGRLAEARAQLGPVTNQSLVQLKTRLLSAIDERDKSESRPVSSSE